ncbi:MAG: ATP-grasp domain-containing protein [Gammaproteobacteria bacterium]|nr:ATP-grasp domain-containing protein [Gammaproteobacteria bacterium]MBU0771124.1 ATP-grasp domain-containing protein [Gammaproteobacteria bacterium]MBU1849063.1 ATP-grasp domain-containing protein [Gammaproteobacteria bacterium]
MSRWLIVSGSANALARSCVAAGWTCDVVDGYGDADTAAHAGRIARAGLRHGSFGSDLPGVIAGMKGNWAGIVTGSGFEARPSLLDALAAFAPLAGNGARTTRHCKAPATFADLMTQSGVRHAPVAVDGHAAAGWLVKRTGGCGGAHVRAARGGERIRRGHHAQLRIAGMPASALFLADGERARIVGVSRQWPGSEAGPYAWAEAISDLALPDTMRGALARDIDAITRQFGLRGLNGVDLVIGDGHHVVIEINPRPTATMPLYEGRVVGGLFAAHVAACEGRLDEVDMTGAGGTLGLRVVYAPRDLIVGDDVEWPAWCTDLPASGSRIRRATPLCTVHASAIDGTGAGALLAAREREVLGMTGLRAGQMKTRTVFS